jgi:hypothetical protein
VTAYYFAGRTMIELIIFTAEFGFFCKTLLENCFHEVYQCIHLKRLAVVLYFLSMTQPAFRLVRQYPPQNVYSYLNELSCN